MYDPFSDDSDLNDRPNVLKKQTVNHTIWSVKMANILDESIFYQHWEPNELIKDINNVSHN